MFRMFRVRRSNPRPARQSATHFATHFAANKIALFLFVLAPFLAAEISPLQAQEFGPENGSLIIVGGGRLTDDIMDRFIELAGGSDANVVVIPTAGGADSYDQDYGGAQWLRDRGAAKVTVLHTYDPEEADTEEFVAPIREATAVWFPGGRQWRLADSYLDNRTHEELWALLDRGGVIGGSSAGASIQGSFLARGDTQGNAEMMGDHQVGLGFLKNSAIDQHVLARNRQFDMIEIIEAHPELLGIGLDESTAIVVQGDQFEVIGRTYAMIYDHESMLDSGGRYYMLSPGNVFDIKERIAYPNSERARPIQRVVSDTWPSGGNR